VTGGGTLAARRVERALSAGAQVKLFAATLADEFRPFLTNAALTIYRRAPESGDLNGAILAYGAEENFEADKRLCDLARAAGVLVNVADTMELCDFITPAIVDRTPLVAAIASSGASPILARIIKAELESSIPATFGELAKFLGQFRDEVAERVTGATQRRRFWEDVTESAVGERVMAGDFKGAEAALRERLNTFGNGGGKPVCEVYLVGAKRDARGRRRRDGRIAADADPGEIPFVDVRDDPDGGEIDHREQREARFDVESDIGRALGDDPLDGGWHDGGRIHAAARSESLDRRLRDAEQFEL
jgi:siroheme synthase-like protein